MSDWSDGRWRWQVLELKSVDGGGRAWIHKALLLPPEYLPMFWRIELACEIGTRHQVLCPVVLGWGHIRNQGFSPVFVLPIDRQDNLRGSRLRQLLRDGLYLREIQEVREMCDRIGLVGTELQQLARELGIDLRKARGATEDVRYAKLRSEYGRLRIEIRALSERHRARYPYPNTDQVDTDGALELDYDLQYGAPRRPSSAHRLLRGLLGR